jgi:HSP20 family protein
MAETPQSPSSEDKAQTAGRAAEPTARKGQATIEGEPRSFKGNGDTHTGGAAGELAQKAAQTGQQLAETGWRAGREVADAWRGSLEPFAVMQMEMTRFIDDTFRQLSGFGFFPSALRSARPFAAVSAAPLLGLPATDIKATDKAYVLAVELPGLTRNDVDIAIDGDLLTVSGHKAEEREDASAAYRVSERRYGRFERSFAVPPDVDRKGIEAQFKDGVLKVLLPRDASAGGRRSKIEIRA